MAEQSNFSGNRKLRAFNCFYNEDDCLNEKCEYLHLCIYYVAGRCNNEDSCWKSHAVSYKESLKIKRFGFDPSSMKFWEDLMVQAREEIERLSTMTGERNILRSRYSSEHNQDFRSCYHTQYETGGGDICFNYDADDERKRDAQESQEESSDIASDSEIVALGDSASTQCHSKLCGSPNNDSVLMLKIEKCAKISGIQTITNTDGNFPSKLDVNIESEVQYGTVCGQKGDSGVELDKDSTEPIASLNRRRGPRDSSEMRRITAQNNCHQITRLGSVMASYDSEDFLLDLKETTSASYQQGVEHDLDKQKVLMDSFAGRGFEDIGCKIERNELANLSETEHRKVVSPLDKDSGFDLSELVLKCDDLEVTECNNLLTKKSEPNILMSGGIRESCRKLQKILVSEQRAGAGGYDKYDVGFNTRCTQVASGNAKTMTVNQSGRPKKYVSNKKKRNVNRFRKIRDPNLWSTPRAWERFISLQNTADDDLQDTSKRVEQLSEFTGNVWKYHCLNDDSWIE